VRLIVYKDEVVKRVHIEYKLYMTVCVIQLLIEI